MPTYKGSYDESMTAGDRRLPRRQRAAHPAGVRGRHRDDDGQQGRDRAGRQGDEGRRPEVRPQRLRAGGGRLLHRAERPDAELPVQQLDARSSTTTRTPSRPPASTRTSRRRPGPKWRWPPPSSRPAATSARSPPLAELDPARELLGLAQRRVRDQEQRLRRPGRAPGVQLAAARAPHREPGQHGQAGPVRLQGPRQRAPRPPSSRASAR